MRYPDVETREQNERAWRGCDAVGCHSHGKGAFAILRVGNSVNEHHVGLQSTFSSDLFSVIWLLYMLFIYDEAFHPPTIIRYHWVLYSLPGYLEMC